MRYAQAALHGSLHIRAGDCGMRDAKQFIRWAPEGKTVDGRTDGNHCCLRTILVRPRFTRSAEVKFDHLTS
jgi:hypothetical protein